jgi:hypothetical protein
VYVHCIKYILTDGVRTILCAISSSWMMVMMLLLVLRLLFCVVGGKKSISYYVDDAIGNDSNNGTDPLLPFKSFQGSAAAVSSIDGNVDEVSVKVAPGVYSGASNCGVTFLLASRSNYTFSPTTTNGTVSIQCDLFDATNAQTKAAGVHLFRTFSVSLNVTLSGFTYENSNIVFRNKSACRTGLSFPQQLWLRKIGRCRSWLIGFMRTDNLQNSNFRLNDVTLRNNTITRTFLGSSNSSGISFFVVLQRFIRQPTRCVLVTPLSRLSLVFAVALDATSATVARVALNDVRATNNSIALMPYVNGTTAPDASGRWWLNGGAVVDVQGDSRERTNVSSC